MSEPPAGQPDCAELRAEITRLNKVVAALIDRAERATGAPGSSFNLFQTTVTLEEQVRERTRALEQALHENERITADLARAKGRMEREMEERRRAEGGLRLAATVFSSTQDGILIADGAGVVVAANPAVTAISEYGAEDLLGQPLRAHEAQGLGEAVSAGIWEQAAARGLWQGEVWNRRKSGEAYLEWRSINSVRDERGRVVNYILVFSDITRLRQAHRLEHLANHDSLTGLPNRRLLLARLTQALERSHRHGSRGAVLFFDLDRFKNVNDSLGHAAGDELLRRVADRLLGHMRRVDTLARLSGDEFVAVLEDLPDPARAAHLAQGLLDLLRAPFYLADSHEIYVGASLGIALFPDDATEPGRLLELADTALFQVKEHGRGGYRFYTEAMTRAAAARVRLEAALRRAVEHGEFLLHYQPLISLTDQRATGVEALVRWRAPDGRIVPPEEFIPVAEETGLIVPLGEWVLGEACSAMQGWLAAGVPLATVAVNLSPRQFSHPGLQRQVEGVLAQTGLRRGQLELELTESAIMEPGRDAAARLSALKGLGVRLAIDDFGTGYSSLAYLKHFPIDKLKIDRSFVRDLPDAPADRKIAAAVIALARNMRLEVLAEGVETAAQLGFMNEHRCDSCQGFLFSRPLPEPELLGWIAARGWELPA